MYFGKHSTIWWSKSKLICTSVGSGLDYGMGVQKYHYVLIIGKYQKCISQALTYCFLYFYPPMFGSVYGSASTNRHGPQLVCQCAIWTNLYLSVSHFFTSCSQRTWQHSTLLYRATTLPCQPANCPRYTHTFPLNWLHQPLGNFTCFLDSKCCQLH